MKRILIVEDDLSIATVIKQYIEEINPRMEIISFEAAADALRYLQMENIDLFILDIQLTDYKGTSLAKQIRAIPNYKYTPIIFASALAGEELMAYREIKCYSFLIKPFSKSEFKEAFCDAIGMRQSLQAPIKTIRIEQKQFVFEYEVNRIVYIESFGKKVVIHTKNNRGNNQEDCLSGYSLKKLLEMIDSNMIFQCHKSFLVNRQYITKIEKSNKVIWLKDLEVKIPIGNKYQACLWGEKS